MAWAGSATTEEKKTVLQAIDKLYHAEHISAMSYKQIASACEPEIKETAVRWIVPLLVEEGYVERLSVGDGKVPRYFYIPQPSAEDLLNE